MKQSTRLLTTALASAVLSITGQANAATNLVINGTFDNFLSGWSLVNNDPSTDISNSLGNPPRSFGNRNQNSISATLSQSISTTPGSHYTVSFEFLNFEPGPSGSEDMQVLFGGQNIVNGILNQGTGTFDTYTFSGILASSNSSILEFSGFDSGTGWYVDNVTVHETSSTASVPGPLPVLGAVAALGFSRKLRSRIKASNKGPQA